MNIYVKKLREDAQLPTRGSAAAAGLDLYSAEDVVIAPLSRALIKTGISVAVDHGTYFRIAPRSGLALKHGIDVMAGVVDSDYRGEIGVILVNLNDSPFSVLKGDRIAQGIVEMICLAHVVEVNDLDSTDRGSNGFGSTG
jgi:deoxyuridine 5'-triphosphate nucleotidohydrolase